MSRKWDFDKQSTKNFVRARQESLAEFLDSVPEGSIQTAVDLGCGLGDFTVWLEDHGIKTTGVDGRSENIEEARKRYSRYDFRVGDVQLPDIQKTGTFDLVLAVGLIYHLENPFAAIRNIFALTKRYAFIETKIIFTKKADSILIDEGETESQGLRYIAFIPSRSTVVKMLYTAGFSYVYSPVHNPDHLEFEHSLTRIPKRTVLIASKEPIVGNYMLLPNPSGEPKPTGSRFPRIAAFLLPLRRIIKI